MRYRLWTCGLRSFIVAAKDGIEIKIYFNNEAWTI